MDNHEFIEILKHILKEKKDLQKRLDMVEEILHSYLPLVGEDEQKDTEIN